MCLGQKPTDKTHLDKSPSWQKLPRQKPPWQKNEKWFVKRNMIQRVSISLYFNTVKPVLRGHDLWDNEKVAL
jgi:hypothetical protein